MLPLSGMAMGVVVMAIAAALMAETVAAFFLLAGFLDRDQPNNWKALLGVQDSSSWDQVTADRHPPALSCALLERPFPCHALTPSKAAVDWSSHGLIVVSVQVAWCTSSLMFGELQCATSASC